MDAIPGTLDNIAEYLDSGSILNMIGLTWSDEAENELDEMIARGDFPPHALETVVTQVLHHDVAYRASVGQLERLWLKSHYIEWFDDLIKYRAVRSLRTADRPASDGEAAPE